MTPKSSSTELLNGKIASILSFWCVVVKGPFLNYVMEAEGREGFNIWQFWMTKITFRLEGREGLNDCLNSMTLNYFSFFLPTASWLKLLQLFNSLKVLTSMAVKQKKANLKKEAKRYESSYFIIILPTSCFKGLSKVVL